MYVHIYYVIHSALFSVPITRKIRRRAKFLSLGQKKTRETTSKTCVSSRFVVKFRFVFRELDSVNRGSLDHSRLDEKRTRETREPDDNSPRVVRRNRPLNLRQTDDKGS